jgi:hypothetical protein
VLKFKNKFGSLRVNANCVPLNSPFRDVSGPVARFADIVENLPHLAAITAWHVAVNAHVEVLTVLLVGVPRVLLSLCHRYLRTRELEDVCKNRNRP